MRALFMIPEKYLRAAAYTIVSIIFLVPIITSGNFYFPFITPRNFLFRIGVELLLVVYGLLIVQNKSYLPPKSKGLILFGLFAASLTIASIFGSDPRFSFWGNYERMDGLLSVFHLFLFLVMLRGIISTRLDWERLLSISLFIALVVALVGFSQFTQVNLLLESSGGERISSTLGNATYLASYLLLHLFVALYFLFKRFNGSEFRWLPTSFIVLDVVLLLLQGVALTRGVSGIIQQIFSNGLFVIVLIAFHVLGYAMLARSLAPHRPLLMRIIMGMSIALFLFLISITQTRGALVGLAAAFAALYVYSVFSRSVSVRAKLIATAVLVFAVAGLLVLFANKNAPVVQKTPILSKIASISISDPTTVTRLVTWKAALKGFSERPIFGWGIESFHAVFNKHFPPVIYTDEGTPLWFDRPHNLLIQYAVEGGVVAFILYLGFLAAIIIPLLKKRGGASHLMIACALIANVVQNFFVFDSINSYVPFYLLAGFSMFLTDPQRAIKGVAPMRRNAALGLVLGTAVLSIFAIVFLNLKPLRANYRYVQAYKMLTQDLRRSSISERTRQELNDIFDHDPYLGRNEILGVTSELMVGALQERRIADSQLAPVVDDLVVRYDRAREMKKDDARFNLLEMNLLLNAARLDLGYADKLISIGEQSLSLSPTRPHMYYVIGRARMMKRQYAEGLANFKKAVELAPHVYDSHWNLFAAYVTVGDKESAARELVTLRSFGDLLLIQYKRIASVYAAGRYFAESEEILKEAIGKFPNSAELYAALADVSLSEGKFDEARAAVAQAVKIDPSIKDQADAFLKELEEKERAQKASP